MPVSTIHRFSSFILALTLAMPGLAMAAQDAGGHQCPRASGADRPRIGLVLGGGGARGGAHIGVLKKLEEMRIPVDYVAGTSMGAIIGGLYAAGMTSADIEGVLAEADWADLFSDATQRRDRPLRRKTDDNLGLYGPKLGIGKQGSWLPGGAVAGQKVSLLLENVLTRQVQTRDFDALPIPFRAVAADIVTGDMVVLAEGQLSMALRSSMSVPGAFDPVPYGDALLVDGGIVRNLPVDVVRAMGADIVIAVNVEYPLLAADELAGLLSIVAQLSTLMVLPNSEAQIATLGENDVLVAPQLGTEFGSADFERIGEVVPVGYEAAASVGAKLQTLSVSEPDYRRWRSTVQACVTGLTEVQFVHLENGSRFADEIIREKLSIRAGNVLDQQQLEQDLRRIHALGFIRLARYELVEENGRQGVVIHVEPDQRGSDFIETGLEITGDARGTGLNLKMAYLKTDLDRHGSEFRGGLQLGEDVGLLAEYYQPLDDRLRWILKPSLFANRRDFRVYDGTGHTLEEWELNEYSAEIAFGREFGRHAGLFLSLSRYTGQASIEVGDPRQPDFSFDGADWSVEGIYDRLDNRYLPSEGSLVRLQYINSDTRLGADAEFEQLRFSLFSARTRGRHTAWFGSEFNTTLDDDAPIYGLFTGGGFLNMSGFQPDELIGQHFGYSMLGYRYEFGSSGILPAYAGMTVEYGNAAQRSRDVYGDGVLNGSVYLGYDSPLGPLYLGLGWSEENSGLLFLRLGTLLGGQSIGRR
jgi:NTE family protein